MCLRKFNTMHIERLYHMSDLYKRIEALCEKQGINITTMCKGAGVSRASLTDLKMERKQSLSTETLWKIANYFEISMDSLLGAAPKKAPTPERARKISDEELKFALWGDSAEIDEEDIADVKRYAAFIKERKREQKQ